jgi:hypothetical protein
VDMKSKIDDVLRSTGFFEARPAKMAIVDLLKYVPTHDIVPLRV